MLVTVALGVRKDRSAQFLLASRPSTAGEIDGAPSYDLDRRHCDEYSWSRLCDTRCREAENECDAEECARLEIRRLQNPRRGLCRYCRRERSASPLAQLRMLLPRS